MTYFKAMPQTFGEGQVITVPLAWTARLRSRIRTPDKANTNMVNQNITLSIVRVCVYTLFQRRQRNVKRSYSTEILLKTLTCSLASYPCDHTWLYVQGIHSQCSAGSSKLAASLI
jgi:hypothetical protein